MIKKVIHLKGMITNMCYSGIDGQYIKPIETTLTKIKNETLSKSVSKVIPKKFFGGMITFSTDVNTVKLSPNKVINYIKQKFQSMSNKLLLQKKLTKIVNRYNNKIKNNENKVSIDELFKSVEGWTIGYMKCWSSYTSNEGKIYKEKSLSIQLRGITKSQLVSLAEDICRKIEQDEVLVRCYSPGEILIVK